MSFGEQKFENLPLLSTENPENIKEMEPFVEKEIESAVEMKIPERKKSTKVGDILKWEQIMKELKNPQGVNPETKKNSEEIATGEKLKFREMKEKMQLNDIFVPEEHAVRAEDLLNEAGIKFEVKRFTEEEQENLYFASIKKMTNLPIKLLQYLNKQNWGVIF